MSFSPFFPLPPALLSFLTHISFFFFFFLLLWVPGNFGPILKCRKTSHTDSSFWHVLFLFSSSLSSSVFSLFLYRILPQNLCRKRYTRARVNRNKSPDHVSVKAGTVACSSLYPPAPCLHQRREMDCCILVSLHLYKYLHKEFLINFLRWLQEDFFNCQK